MKKPLQILLVGLFITIIASFCFAKEVDALKQLRKARPDIQWKNKFIIVDIDCNGNPDKVFYVQDAKSISIGLVMNGNTKTPIVDTLVVARGKQGSLCSLPVKVSKYSLDLDIEQAVISAPGFKRSRSCQSVQISDDQCDSFHLYWNHAMKSAQWWRQ
jgi:hypothetical protein